jgi:peptide/nickel transport system permease protein
MVWQRVGIGLATLWVVSVIVFIATSILPGDVAQIILGQAATPETLAALRAELGLDQPGYVRYFSWLGNMLSGDLGISKAGGATISSLIGGRLGNTMMMAAWVAIISIPISIALGLWAAMHPGTWLDRIVTFGTLSLISVPEFFIATVAVLILAVNLHWLPSTAYLTGEENFGELMKALASPYIEMAILKGVPRGRIILRHAFFNAIGPIINVIALNLAYLVSGVVIVETIFAYPGLAKLMIDGVQTRDLPLVQACAMIFCGTYVVLILIADIGSIVSNPRLRSPK